MSSDSGIYRITNLVNNHSYVGSSRHLKRRRRDHFSTLRKHRHHSPRLQNAWNKYGEIAFEFVILELCDPPNLKEQEQHYIDLLGSYCAGYNSMPRASYQGDEIADRISNSLRGREFTAEHRANLSKANRERMLKDPRRFALAEFASHPGETNPFFGKHHSDETKKLLSLKNTGYVADSGLRKIRSNNARGERNSQYGKRFRYFTDGVTTRKIQAESAEDFLKGNPTFRSGMKRGYLKRLLTS